MSGTGMALTLDPKQIYHIRPTSAILRK
jgi:hypothetical protein